MVDIDEPRLATIDRDGFELADAEARARENPQTFSIPAIAKRYHLQKGSSAKIILVLPTPLADGRGGERLWFTVEGKKEGWYLGSLANEPVLFDHLRMGYKLWFRPWHIVDIIDIDDV